MQKVKTLKLKEGEGLHTHILNSNKDFEFEAKEYGFDLLLSSSAKVTHDEHGEVRLNADKIICCTQSEYDPFSNNFREIFD